MKVFVWINNYFTGESDSKQGWYLLADSVITNVGKPFYLPDLGFPLTVSLGIAVKLSRLGKSINEKFASKYYTEYAPVLHFRSEEYSRKLLEEGLPADAARNFDKALFVGDFQPIENYGPLELYLNNELQCDFKIEKLVKPIDRLISEFSRMNTLKMGDFMVPGLSGAVTIKEGDILGVNQDGNCCFKVRVK